MGSLIIFRISGSTMAEENSYPLVPLGQGGPSPENDALSSTSAVVVSTDVTDEEKQSMVAAWVAASSSAFDYTLFRIRAPGGGGQPVAAAGATSGSWNMPSSSRRGTNGGVGTDPVSVVPFNTSVGWDTAPPGNRRGMNGASGTTGPVLVPAASVGWNMPSGNRRDEGNTGPDQVPAVPLDTSGSHRGTNGGGGGPVRPVPVRAVPFGTPVGWPTQPSCSRTNGGGATAGPVPMPATSVGWPTPSGSRSGPVQVPFRSPLTPPRRAAGTCRPAAAVARTEVAETPCLLRSPPTLPRGIRLLAAARAEVAGRDPRRRQQRRQKRQQRRQRKASVTA